MSYVETAWNHANIPVELAGLRPLGDFVLVRVLPEEEMHKNLIWLPQFSGAHADRASRPVRPSIGEVIACGPGDRLFRWYCAGCCFETVWTTTKSPSSKCIRCGDQDWKLVIREPGERRLADYRHPMHVSPGDRVLYWKSPANELILNDETFQFIHEEQYLLGVIEQ